MTTSGATTTSTGTLVYDADCGFCTVCADWLADHGTATLEPWQALDLEALGLTVDDVTTAAYWLDADGRVAARGAGAVSAALRTCRGGYPLLGRLMRLPVARTVADAAYGVVARNRHRLPGGTAACKLD